MAPKKVKPAKKAVKKTLKKTPKKTLERASTSANEIKDRFGKLGPILKRAAALAEDLNRLIPGGNQAQLQAAADSLDRELLNLHKWLENWNHGAQDPPPPGEARPLYALRVPGRIYVGC